MSEHLSRQDLVVPPQGSNLRFALTAAACASAGFALVWGALGLRGWMRPGDAPAPASVDTWRQPVGADATGEIAAVASPPGAADPLPTETRVASRFEAHSAVPMEEPAAGHGDRYSRRAAGFRDAPPSTEEPLPIDAPAPRFGAPLEAEIGAVDPGASSDDGGGVIVVAGSGSADDEGDDLPVSDPADLAADPSDAPPGRFGADEEPLADTPSPVADEPAAPLPEDRGDLGVPDSGALDALPGDDATDDPAARLEAAATPAAPPFNPFAAAPPAAGVSSPGSVAPSASRPVPPLGAAPIAPAGSRAPSWPTTPAAAAGSIDHDPEAPVPVERTTREPARDPSVGMPFAAAPPLAASPSGRSPASSGPPAPFAPSPPPGAGPSHDASLGHDPAAGPSTPSGQGRPGAMHLEGVQTPQLAVEKRGPREIQVGKAARFEILVRNVGSAQANDVVLRDAVPAGTALVATTPPAAPAGAGHAPGELVWLLGTIPPGGQARVGIDLMPVAEGEVGSVASVSFRADASVRARATRPALSIAVQPPSPVLVGTDSRVTITVSNPGSGVATGVVLEGLLPEGLAHRAGRELEFDVGSLPPGESRSIDLVLATTGPGSHGMRLLARADGQIEVAETVKVPVTAPTLDVAVEMPSRRYLQRPATCSISLGNAGTAPAVGVELVAQLPPGLKFVRANNAGYYEERTHRVLWNLEELPAAETGLVEVVLMPVALGPQKIVAAARTAAGLSDQATHTVEVEGLAALSFEVADSEDPIEIGGVSEYVVRVANQGTKPASGVRVAATLLGDMEPVDARGPAPHRVDNLTIAFEPLAKLAPSEEALYRIRVRGRREGDQRVQVQLTSDEQPAPITKEETTRVYADR